MTLSIDQKAVSCNAVIDRMFFYDNDSQAFGIYDSIAMDYLSDLEEENHPFYKKLMSKWMTARMHKHARLMEEM